MLPRILEPELMDSAEDAHEYDAMDHAAVNTQFVTDLLAAFQKGDWSIYGSKQSCNIERATAINGPVPFFTLQILDLGAGTAQIPIALARRTRNVQITAIDAAESMLALACRNVAAAGLNERISTIRADAKHLPFNDGAFLVVISNSIVHHIPDPRTVLAEATRVTAPGGLLFHRDLARPNDESELERLVDTYAAGATPYQRKLFADSLRAALTAGEVRELITGLGFAPDSVQMTSDRHWTWSTTNL